LVTFTDLSTGASTYNWTFGDGAISTSTNPTNTYTTNGTYTVTLLITSGTCVDTATAIIFVENGLSLEIPNVFTPNGDGTNDLFTILSTGVKEIDLQIFNRWGQKLFSFSGPKAAWDGLTETGAKVPDGTYFFFVKATGFDNKTIEKQGTVNLFR
jgi:gliding motility-associated-like protein